MPSNGNLGPTVGTTICSAVPYPTLTYAVVLIVPASWRPSRKPSGAILAGVIPVTGASRTMTETSA